MSEQLDSSSGAGSSSGLSLGQIAGIVLGVVIGTALFVVIAMLYIADHLQHERRNRYGATRDGVSQSSARDSSNSNDSSSARATSHARKVSDDQPIDRTA